MTIAEQLTRDEQEVLHAYPDSEGYLTIGIGRLIDKRKGGGISHEEALYLLKNDIDTATALLAANLPWTATLDEARRGVLINMTFNMGIHGLMEFRNTLAAIQAGDYKLAALGMINSKWATQTGPRAHRLAQQIESGEWI